MKINTDGLILKRSSVGEHDRLVTVLTRDLGVIRAFVHGANKPKSQTASATDTLCYSSFTVTRNKDTYTLTEVAPIEIFFDLRADIEKVSLAQYFCEVMLAMETEGENAEEPLRLLLNCLYLLMKNLRPAAQIKAIFELRMMSIAGYMPDLTACAVCGNEPQGGARFRIEEGTVACETCDGGVAISHGVLQAMRYIIARDLDHLFSFDMSAESLRALGTVTERYLLTHTDRTFTALTFYKSL